MRNESKYVSLKLEWDKYVKSITDKITFDLINEKLTPKELQDKIYAELSKQGFDDKGFKFIYESAKIGDPTLTEKQFYKKYIHQPNGNILDNIDNKATTDRMVKRLEKDVGVLSGRVDRLGEYRKDITVASVDSTIKDVGRMIDANKTVERNIEKQIKDNNWLLKRTDLTPAERKSIKDNQAILNAQLKSVKTSNKALSKQYNTFANSYTGLTENGLKKAYTKLIDNVEKDIVNKQQPLVFEQTLNASGSSPMKRTAQTQFTIDEANNVIKYLQDKQSNSGETVYVKWELSSMWSVRTCVTRICEEKAKGGVNGDGIYPIDEAPHPVRDTHINCRCQLVEVDNG